MRRKSNLVLVPAVCLALLNLPANLILNLTLGSLAIAFSGWLLNRRRVSKLALSKAEGAA